MKKYAAVLVNVVTDATDRFFSYGIPESMQDEIYPGRWVTVPFSNRIVEGCVWETGPEPGVARVKDIIAPGNPGVSLSPEFLQLAPWFQRRYYCRLMEAVNLLMPPGYGRVRDVPEKIVALSPEALTNADSYAGSLQKRAPRQYQVFMELKDAPAGLLLKALISRLEVSSAIIKSMQDKGLLIITEKWVAGTSDDLLKPSGPVAAEPGPVLTPEQTAALAPLSDALAGGTREDFLIHGVTGSGKTEVYLRAVHQCLARGKGALVMVPEIALTPQMINYFEKSLPGELALWHSSLARGERYRQWFEVKEGRRRVVLGTRSAVFAPVPRLGLMVIDEEQENSYKQDETPRYHARDVARWRVDYAGALLVYGSATPSVETYRAAEDGAITLLEMKKRATPFPLPEVEVVDMKAELKQGNRTIFSRRLTNSLQEVMDKGEQALLYINRRGFTSFVLCRDCGYVVRCSSCSVSLTYHNSTRNMICHYCSGVSAPPELCPSCRGVNIRHFGTGTQKVAEEVEKLFPGAGVLRMDRDTTSRRGAHGRLWKDFLDKKARIMVGTQMIAKGLDFPGVTLVGVIAADTGLHLPDFRAGERTYQLLAQVSGRAGRGNREGKVIIQTYHPYHHSIQCVKEHNYLKFYWEEITQRAELHYPPFSQMLRFIMVSLEEDNLSRASRLLADEFIKLKEQHDFPALTGAETEMLGPAPAPILQIKKYYRYQLIIKGNNLDKIADYVMNLLRKMRNTPEFKDVRLMVDFNPLVLL